MAAANARLSARASGAPSFLPPARDDVPMVAVAHGTAHLPGLATLDAIAGRIRFLRPGLRVSLSFVSVASPTPQEVLAGLAAQGEREAVVVPMFLGSGYHVRHDIPAAVRSVEAEPLVSSMANGSAAAAGLEAASGEGRMRVYTARPLGPDPMLAHVLTDRLAAVTGRVFGTEVVLAAAGSNDRRATADAVVMAGLLAERLGMPVRAAFLTAA